ncbi:hypothetical protein ACFL47_06910, partial [Candidatus Latescibacterota bacterium]
MRKNLMINSAALLSFFLLIGTSSFAQESNTLPVRIIFDKNSKRIDIETGKQVPDYTYAQRGSFQFYDKRLDSPTDHINYMFATMISSKVKDIILMRKIHSQNVWALSGSGNILGLKSIIVADIVKEYSVSFIPLNPVTHKPDHRVYVLLQDMYLIQWAELDHWAATKSQEEFEA